MKTQWTKQTDRFERHTAPVYKLDWAHPEFGQASRRLARQRALPRAPLPSRPAALRGCVVSSAACVPRAAGASLVLR